MRWLCIFVCGAPDLDAKEKLMRLGRISLLVIFSIAFPAGIQSQVQDSSRNAQKLATIVAGCRAIIGASSIAVDQPVHGIDATDLDRSIAPCDDFYQFANGGWFKRNPIPPEYPAWGVGQKVERLNQEVLQKILEEAAKDKNSTAGSNK